LLRHQKAQKIEELNQKLSALKEQKSKLNAEARVYVEKRDEFNERFNSLRAEILKLKNERDKLNEKVSELKQQRSKVKTEAREKIEELKKIRQEIEILTNKKPSKNLQTLQKEVEKIEWRIQTTSLDLQKEKELVEQVGKLETQINIYKKLDQLNQKRLEMQAEIKALETKAKLDHEKLTETAQKSQEIHKNMLQKIDEAKKAKIEADNLHQLYIQTKEKIRPLQEGIAEILNQIKQLKEEIRREEERDKKKSEEALHEEIENQAREKLKRGEKLTWEEFQILAEKGMTTQD
jgi:uncharacterized coiled-coil DUF342 family protein